VPQGQVPDPQAEPAEAGAELPAGKAASAGREAELPVRQAQAREPPANPPEGEGDLPVEQAGAEPPERAA
jgi:hypothetical protein